MTKSILILATGLFMGCAENVTHNDAGPYAPKSAAAKAKAGTVAYNPDGVRELVDSRRQDALKKIFTACGSNNYQIKNEEIKHTKGMASGSIATIGATRLNYIDYECKD